MKTFTPQETAILLIDVQEGLFPHLDRSPEVLVRIATALKGFRTLGCQIFATEQYPEGLGETVQSLKALLGNTQKYYSKTTFSCMKDPVIQKLILGQPQPHWILVGAEAHICILQTALDLLGAGKSVTILNDTITSRSIFDYSTAIAEMRDSGVRITTLETILFQCVGDSRRPEFKAISSLLKPCQNCCCTP